MFVEHIVDNLLPLPLGSCLHCSAVIISELADRMWHIEVVGKDASDHQILKSLFQLKCINISITFYSCCFEWLFKSALAYQFYILLYLGWQFL